MPEATISTAAPSAIGRIAPRAAPWAIVAVALAVHLAWLTHPLQVVLDETFFGRYALAYLKHSWYFDLHPPLAKLFLGATAWLLGLDPAFSYATNGLPFPDPKYALLRLPVHAAGVLLPLVLYGIARELKLSLWAAFVVGMLCALDNALLVISRVALTDAFLLLFGFASLWLYLRYRRRGGAAGFIAAVLLAGCAISVKWTGLSFLGLIGALEAIRAVRERRASAALRLAALALLPVAVYLAVFALHFAWLDRVGDAPIGLSPAFQATFVGSPLHDDAAQPKAGFIAKVVEVNRLMLETSRNMTARHAYGSRWYDWPFMLRPLDFWADYAGPVLSRIYLLGNPVVWWASAYCMLYLLVNFVPKLPALASRAQPAPAGAAEILLVCAYLANMLPFTQIKRVMFIYHYLPALGFALLAVGLLLDRSGRHARWLGGVLLALAAAAFVWFAPLSYGLPITKAQLDARFWLDTWR